MDSGGDYKKHLQIKVSRSESEDSVDSDHAMHRDTSKILIITDVDNEDNIDYRAGPKSPLLRGMGLDFATLAKSVGDKDTQGTNTTFDGNTNLRQLFFCYFKFHFEPTLNHSNLLWMIHL